MQGLGFTFGAESRPIVHSNNSAAFAGGNVAVVCNEDTCGEKRPRGLRRYYNL